MSPALTSHNFFSENTNENSRWTCTQRLKRYTVGLPQLMIPPEMLRRVWSEAIQLLSLHLPINRGARLRHHQWRLVGLFMVGWG
jgi:hypothetical protein